MKRTVTVLVLAGLALSCNEQGGSKKGPSDRDLVSGKQQASTTTPVAKDSTKHVKKDMGDTTTYNRDFNDIARFIAGMKQEDGSPYAALEKDTVWVRHSKEFDKSWAQLESKRLKEMRDWSNEELASEHTANLDIFYPLSGPDILHANCLFPMAKHYHLYALERAGALPDLKHMKPKEIENYLGDAYTSLGDVFTKSYFITHKMLTDLQRQNVNGTLPLICIFLVRTNNRIINVRYYHLNDDGSETPLNKDSAATHGNDFVKVYFKHDGDNSSMQSLTYIKCDLADGGIKENKGLAAYFNNMPVSFTYLKSASYLLHYKFFNTLRDVILNKSQAVLEDDTGIPYKYFGKDKWNIFLYGTYVMPVNSFSGVFQDDLSAAYKDTVTSKPKKLPFSLGYHWGTNNQNLLKAERKG